MNGDGSKKERKNMNLSAKVFRRLERLKRRQARDLRGSLAWDDYMAGVADREEVRSREIVDR